MSKEQSGRLDLNNPVFQKQLFAKQAQTRVLGILRKLQGINWQMLYQDNVLRWVRIHSKPGPKGACLYTFRISKKCRVIAFREGNWLRLLSIQPDHDSAYT